MGLKLIIAGSRTLYFAPYVIAQNLVKIGLGPNEIVGGGAKGIDLAGKHFAQAAEIKYTEFPADWGKFGRSAGPKRNRQMAKYADSLFLVWDGTSRGSKNMKEEMLRLNKPVYEYRVMNGICTHQAHNTL